jgi:predicted nucleic acid-binding protein
MELFDLLDWLPLDSAASERATEVQREMAQIPDGNHRHGAIDFLIAAVAEAAGPEYILWHFDTDLRAICEHTGQPQEAEDSASPGR